MPWFPPITTVKGSLLPSNYRQTGRFDPTRGYVYTYDWKGADQQLAQDLWYWYASQGIAATLTFEADKAELVAVDSTSEYSIDSWEIVEQEQQLDLFNDPDFLSAISTVANSAGYINNWNMYNPGQPVPTVYDIIGWLNQGLESNTKVNQLSDYAALFYFATVLPVVNGVNVWYWICDYYFRKLSGAETFQVIQYTLKHKFNISNRSGLMIYDFGVNQIYTPAQMLAEVSNYALWIFPLPPRLQFKLAAIPPIKAPPPPSGFVQSYLWGWLKSGSPETTEAQNRVNVETNYVAYLWDQYVYSPYAGGDGGGDS